MLGRRELLTLVGAAAAVTLVPGCTSGPGPTPSAPPTPRPASTAVDADRIAALVEAMPKRSVGDLAATRLAPGLTPPTNRWFSGLVFGEQAQPVFPLPLGFALVEGGFEMWLPQVAVSEKAIIGQRTAGMTLTTAGVSSALVTGYDVASVTIELRDAAGAGVLALRLTQGVPGVSVTALQAVSVAAQVPWTGSGVATVGTTSFGVRGGQVSGQDVRLAAGEAAVFFAAPPGVDPATLREHATPVTGTSVTWESGEDTVSTSLSFGTATLHVAMPHHEAAIVDPGESLGSYPSVYGPLTLRYAATLTWTAPRWPVAPALDLSGLSEADRRTIADVAARDLAATRPAPADTYFGGKALYRESQLLSIAGQVGVDATNQRATVTAEIEAWAQPGAADERATRCFVYDEAARGIVGLESSFGSELFNDHHFHYGYFLHAAGTLAVDDPGLAERLAPVFDLLAADIASPQDSGLFPALRGFDVYAGHSWASGVSPFADGNNQESSSEAVNAWAGLMLWARARGDAALEAQATWLHALEAQTALAYWLQPDLSAFPGYTHRIVGLGWGAKRDYATWFSPNPEALLMIQVIPAGPGMTYLAHAPDQIPATVAEAIGAGGFARTYADYCLMYASLADRAGAIAALPQVSGIIDDGLTETYVTAFVLSR